MPLVEGPTGKRHVLFDPEKHCGAPARSRNPEFLRKALLRGKRGLAQLKPTSDNFDEKRAFHQRVIRVAEEKLAAIEADPELVNRRCTQPKGFRTDHPSEGYCLYHCGCHGRRSWHDITGNLYRQIRNRSLQDALSIVETQTVDIMDLVPEAKMLKALAVVFFEDAQRKKNLTTKDLESAAGLIDKIGRTIERINGIQVRAGMVTTFAVGQLTKLMGEAFRELANEWDGKRFVAEDFIKSVEATWGSISIDTSAKQLPPPMHERLAETPIGNKKG